MFKINVFISRNSNENLKFSSIGIIIYKDKIIFKKYSKILNKKTNEELNYLGLIVAIEKLIELKINSVNIFIDSQNLINEINNKVFSEVKDNLVNYFILKIKKLLEKIDIKFNLIRKEDNLLSVNLADKIIENKINELKKLNENKLVNSINIENNNKSNNLINSNNIKIKEIKNNSIDNLNNIKNINNEKIEEIKNNTNIKTNSNQNTEIKPKLTSLKLKLDKAFFGKVNCLKIQLNFKKELYFHMGLLNNKNKVWNWEKVKMNENETGELINLLKKDNGKCSFFHSFDKKTTQIWCNKSPNGFTIKIKHISKNLTIGESEVLRIILENSIKIKLFN